MCLCTNCICGVNITRMVKASMAYRFCARDMCACACVQTVYVVSRVERVVKACGL